MGKASQDYPAGSYTGICSLGTPSQGSNDLGQNKIRGQGSILSHREKRREGPLGKQPQRVHMDQMAPEGQENGGVEDVFRARSSKVG